MMKLFTLLLTLIPLVASSQIASWDFTGEALLPTSTAEVYHANLDASNLLTRGSSAAEAAGTNSFRTTGFLNNGIAVTNTDYFENNFSASPGYSLSLSSIDARFAGTATFSATPGVSMQYAYSLDGTNFTLIGSPFSQIGNGPMSQIDLSGISALQNVADNITITIRFYASGQTATGGWGYNSPSSGTVGLAFGGTVTLVTAGCNIATSGITALTCNNAATPSDPADDYVSFDLNPTGSLLGTAYTVSVSAGTITPATGNYGAATSFQLQAGSAGAGNVTVTITDDTGSACTFNQMITDPGACSSAVPVITLTPSSLTGFNHVVGTPSAQQTFTASGLSLTTDITINAPANFEISLTSGTGFTNTLSLVESSGIVSATTIYARANAAALGTLAGNIIATSTGADNDTVTVSGYANDYVSYMVNEINGTNANGVADSLNVLVSLVGVVQCSDFDYNAGYSFSLIDGSGEGINIFRTSDLANYTAPMGGDSIIVRGKVLQFNGLLEIQADSIVLRGTAAEATPMTVTTLSEATESMKVQVLNLTLVTPIATFTANTNINATDGTNTVSIRIPTGSPLDGTAAPQGLFNVTGIGWQYDSSSPYDSGYQLYPCSFVDVCTTPANTTTLSGTSTASSTVAGIDYQWIKCADSSIIVGATLQSFTAVYTGSYAVIVSDGACIDTSACVSLVGTSAGINENTILNSVSVYPNPVQDLLTVKNTSNEAITFVVVDMNGKEISTSTTVLTSTTVSTSNWNKGVYFVKFASINGEAVLRVVK